MNSINSNSVTITGTGSGYGSLILDGSTTTNTLTINPNNPLYRSNGTTQLPNPNWNNGFIGGGTNNFTTTYLSGHKYTLDGNKFETDWELSGVDIMFLTNIEINGYRFYEIAIEKGLVISDEFKSKLEPIIKLMKRKETVNKVLKERKDA